MAKHSAGLLMFQRTHVGPEVLLVHPGGPFWAKKDEGAWTIPKGEPAEGEELLNAAQREFSEETGFPANGPFKNFGNYRAGGREEVDGLVFRRGLRSCGPQEQCMRDRMATSLEEDHSDSRSG